MRFLTIIIALLALALPSPAQERHYTATNLWQADLGYYPQGSPAMSKDGVIYATTWTGRLLAFNPDGKQRWSFRIGFESVSSPAVGEDGTIYFGSRNRRVYAVDAKGRKQWAFKTGGWVDASPAIGLDGTVYVGSWDGNLYALDRDGKAKWQFATGGPIVSSVAIAVDGTFYFGSHDQKFYALKPDGTKLWEFATRGAIRSSPAIGGHGEVYFTSVDGRLFALNADGTLRWALATGGFSSSSPVLGEDGTVYVSVNQTHCAVKADGSFKWRRAFWNAIPNFYGESSAAVLSDGSVVFTGGDGHVMTVPGEDGELEWLWRYWLNGPSYSSPLVGPDGVIYVLGKHAPLQALDRNVPLARSPWPMFRADPQHTGRAPAAR